MLPQQQIHKFEFSRSFKKPQPLVSRYEWEIHGSQTLAEGDVCCSMSRKILCFKRKSPLRQRYLILTAKGALIIYETEFSGFVLDMQKVTEITTSSETFSTRRKHYRRCDVKVKFPQGSIYLHLINDDITKWRDALLLGHEACTKRLNLTTMDDESGIYMGMNGDREMVHDSTTTCCGNDVEGEGADANNNSNNDFNTLPSNQPHNFMADDSLFSTFRSPGIYMGEHTSPDEQPSSAVMAPPTTLPTLSPDVQSDIRSAAKSRNREGFNDVRSPNTSSSSETGSGLFTNRELNTRPAVTSIRSGYVSVKERKREFEARGTIIQCKTPDAKKRPYGKPIMFPMAAYSTKLGVYDPDTPKSS